MGSLTALLTDQYDGTSRSAEEVHRAEIRKKGNEVMGDREFFVLCAIVAISSLQNGADAVSYSGICSQCPLPVIAVVWGRSYYILQHCISLADSWNASLILESAAKGYPPFYIADGFKVAARSQVGHRTGGP